ncbi:CMGC SRPK protein kinase [Rhizoctonia solani]|uniref:non-specific serine/threonine protein kinase n=1 Tax=Rhizoctonia solani TaxID=456999 RepID=A0A8H7H4C0_9AGAM|nr:CMGC SRPK protein kinase [Rhizoctonia solani]
MCTSPSMRSVILPTDADPSVPYRSERVSPGGTKRVVYTIPDPPRRTKTMPVEVVEREEAVGDYMPGGYLRVRIGDRFAHRYRIVRKLGWGHFSTVWLAHDIQTDSHVALKFVKSAPRYSQTAADEVALLQHIVDARDEAHPGRDRLVTFLDSFTHTNARTAQVHHCIAFEPLGMNLLQLLQQPDYKHHGVPVPFVKQITRQVLHGLDYLHRVCELIHTDLKPENILLRIAPDHIENHIRAELASSPPAVEHSIPISASSRSSSYYSHRRQNVYIVGSQPLSSPSPSWSGSASSKPSLSASHAQFEQLALRMSKLVTEEDERQTSANSSCAASAIFSLTSTSAAGSGWTSETEADDCPTSAVVPAPVIAEQPGEDSDTPRLSIVDGPSMLTKTAPVPISTQSEAKPTATEDQVSIKIADLGNATRIGRHVTDDIQTRQYRSPEVILRKRWGPAVFELLTGDFLFEPKAREPLWSRDDDHICQMHEALGPFTHAAAFGGQFSRAIFRSDCTLRNVPARKINMWPLDSVLKDKYEMNKDRVAEISEFLRPLLALDPAERADALDAAQHPWLWS